MRNEIEDVGLQSIDREDQRLITYMVRIKSCLIVGIFRTTGYKVDKLISIDL